MAGIAAQITSYLMMGLILAGLAILLISYLKKPDPVRSYNTFLSSNRSRNTIWSRLLQSLFVIMFLILILSMLVRSLPALSSVDVPFLSSSLDEQLMRELVFIVIIMVVFEAWIFYISGSDESRTGILLIGYPFMAVGALSLSYDVLFISFCTLFVSKLFDATFNFLDS